MTNYCDLNSNREHVIALIKWLIDEVMSAGGDGDGIWYSKYYSVTDIKALIESEKLLPRFWKIEEWPNPALHLGENQEWLTITNSKHDFDTRPEWQQVSIVY